MEQPVGHRQGGGKLLGSSNRQIPSLTRTTNLILPSRIGARTLDGVLGKTHDQGQIVSLSIQGSKDQSWFAGLSKFGMVLYCTSLGLARRHARQGEKGLRREATADSDLKTGEPLENGTGREGKSMTVLRRTGCMYRNWMKLRA